MDDPRRRFAVKGGRLALLALAGLTGCGAMASAGGGGSSGGTALVGAPVPTATAAPPAVLAEHITGVGPLPLTASPTLSRPASGSPSGASSRRRHRHRQHLRPARSGAVPRPRSALTRAV